MPEVQPVTVLPMDQFINFVPAVSLVNCMQMSEQEREQKSKVKMTNSNVVCRAKACQNRELEDTVSLVRMIKHLQNI